MRRSSTWSERREFPLTEKNLSALMRNEIPAIRIKNFATPEECRQMADAMRSGRKKEYGVDRPIGYIGIAQYEFRWGRTKKDYFDAVAQAYADQRFVLDRSFDAMARFIRVVGSSWNARVGIAEEDARPYFAGIIRFASSGIGLHADFAPYNMPGYAVANVTAQLAWNLFVEAPADGGITTVYNAPWSPVIEGEAPPQSYGFSSEAVAGAEAFAYRPVVGDVVIFNSRNPHEVSAGAANLIEGRLQIGSFIGLMPDRTLVLFA